MNHLDRMLAHYLQAVLARAVIQEYDGSWQGRLEYMDSMLIAQTRTLEATRQGLQDLLTRRVFDAMRRGQALPVINGINITPGSC